MVKLFIDSDCDFTLEDAKNYNATMICMPFEMNGKETIPYVDWKEFDDHAYYDILRKGVLPTTSALNPENYISYFEPEFKKGNDIFYVHFSTVMSGSFNAMRLALEELKEKYPERKFYELDTKGITIEGHQVARWACELFKKGEPVEKILEKAKTEVDKFACYFFADDLKFFGKSGRVSGIAAFMGGLIGIRPILTMGSDGKMAACGKVKGRVNAMNKLVDMVQELGEDLENHVIYIGHADAPELVEQFKQTLTERLGKKIKMVVVPVNPTAGAHCGPDTLGVGFYAKHR